MNTKPEVGSMVWVVLGDGMEVKARVRSYHQCDKNSVNVTRARTTELWVVDWRKCKPVNPLKERNSMTPGPLELLGNPLTPPWVKVAIKEALKMSQTDGIFYANVLLMALRKEAQERELDLAAAEQRKGTT